MGLIANLLNVSFFFFSTFRFEVGKSIGIFVHCYNKCTKDVNKVEKYPFIKE